MDAHRAHAAVAPCPGGQGDGLHAQALRRFHPLLDDGRICLPNHAAKRAIRGTALADPRACLRAPTALASGPRRCTTLIVTAKLNDVDPQAWLADVLTHIAEQPHTRVHELLPWNEKADRDQFLTA